MKRIEALSAASLVALLACGNQNAVVGGDCRVGLCDGIAAESGPGTPYAGSTGMASAGGADAGGAPDAGLVGAEPDASGDAGSAADAAANAGTPSFDDAGTSLADDSAHGADASAVDAEATAPDAGDAGPACDPTVTDTDPFNCGVCGNVCQSGLCKNGACVGARSGDVVVLGDDLSSAPSGSSQAREFVNTLLLPSRNPVRVTTYERYAKPNDVARAKALAGSWAASEGRTIVFTPESDEAAVASVLASGKTDVFLVFDQANAAPGSLSPLGASWSTDLAGYVSRGGVAAFLDGGRGTGEMPALVTGTKLLSVASHAPLPSGSWIDLAVPSDAVGTSVLAPFVSRGGVRFQADPEGGRAVFVSVDHVTGDPTAIHKSR